MNEDRAARARALDPAESFIVQAPAGSGKTELLIQRYLKLLAAVDSPDAIVAITFTRKAAGEVRSRVVEALRAVSGGVAPNSDHQRTTFEIARQALEQDRRAGWNLLRNPAQMRIETIDALCISITRRMPWLSRFGAMPEFSEKAEDLYREAARATLRHVDRGNEALGYLLLHLDNDFQRTAQLIVQMLEKRDQWLRHTGASPDLEAVRSQLEATLQNLILSALLHLRASFDSSVAAEIALLLELERFPGARLEDLPAWTTIADLLLTKGNEWRKRVDKTVGFPSGDRRKSRVEDLLARLQREDTLLESLRTFRELPAPRFTDTQWQALQSAVSVLTLAVGELQLVFRERGRVDFAELAIRASEALGKVDSPTDLALALGHRVQHILVDEFQDTSYTQFELLRKLTAGWEPGDGRTLFLVGDPMQSIYRFRQADVSLFLKARLEGIGAVALEPLVLSMNFRSAEQVVTWVNDTFAGIMPDEDDLDLGIVAYAPSVARKDAQEGDHGVTMHGCLDSSDEARRVLELVKQAGRGSTAVLVRARAHLLSIVGELKRNRIPFQAVEIDQLGERQVIEDLMALTLALLHPGDRISWLAVLRAPWCGLKLEDLHSLAGSEHSAAVLDLLRRPELALSEDGAAGIKRILPLLEQAIAGRGRRPLREWVEGVWFRLGGPACVQDETALEDAAAYFDLLDQLADGADLADFDWFRKQVNALFAQPGAPSGESLQLMTIHKAKGLEFDTVILPGLGSPSRKDDPNLLLWLERADQFLIAPVSESGQNADPIYKYLERLEGEKLEHESKRLLYVAATRTRRRLHLLGTLARKDDGSIAEPSSRSFLKLLWPAMSAAFENLPGRSETEEPVARPAIHRVPAGWTTPAPPPPVEWTRRTGILEAAPPALQRAGDALRHAGTALHGFLQRVAREGLEAWDEPSIHSRRNLYQAVLADLGVPPADLPVAVQRVENGLLATLSDPRGRWILERHAAEGTEVPISGTLEGKLCDVVIDRTFVDEAGVRWIIDFKTAVHEGGDIEGFLNGEQERYRGQLERYARLMIQQEERPIRLALYFPLLGGWREWGAPVVLRKQATLFEL